MRSSRIKAKLKRNEPVLLTTLHLTDPSLFELTSLMGFDGIWMDLEHHGYSVETATALMRAARVGGADILARPAKGEFMRLGRLLEAGAQGIMYPRCADAAEAREVVTWSKFAPLGKRGFDSGNADVPYCMMPMDEYVRAANEQTFLVIQLEDRQAVANAKAIAEVEGVDVLFFGPADFMVLNGIPGQFDTGANPAAPRPGCTLPLSWGGHSDGEERPRRDSAALWPARLPVRQLAVRINRMLGN